MGIFDEIANLINEHGSARILNERILLAKEQHAAQERRIIELERLLKESEGKRVDLVAQLEGNRKRRPSDAMEFRSPFYYASGDATPFCPICWEDNQKPIHLPPPFSSAAGPSYTCRKCGTNIVHPRIEPIRSATRCVVA